MSEKLWWNFESNENIPQLKQATPEEVNKVKDDIGCSNRHIKINNVLNVLDYPDNIEEKFRKVLEKQDDNTLIELARKQKSEVLSFFKNQEFNKTSEKAKEYEFKISKLNSIFTPEILTNNPDIANNFEWINLVETNEQKEAILQGIINLLQEPWVLNSIINDLGWASKDNPKYIEFRETLISLDPSFESYFPPIETQSIWLDSATNEVLNSIQNDSNWTINIDLNSDTPVSKMSLVWSDYSFDKEIDKQALTDINTENINKLKGIQNSFAVLKGVYTPFNNFINHIKLNCTVNQS